VVREFLGGTVNADGTGNPLPWDAPITENVPLNAAETWEIHNFTPGGHSFHIHLIQFQVLDRRPIGGGTATPPGAHEVGPKDVVFVPQGITRFRALFDRRSLYVWHCHFIDHEDHGMMRPWRVS
jgi:FtsP/CotA-like multicopper oxidase with cupredoxin domain